MRPKFIIDGYNVLHLVNEYQKILQKDLESARDALIHDLQVYRAHKQVDVLIVFDGAADVPVPYHNQQRGQVRVLFSRAPMKADPVILQKIAADARKRRITVVSADREITHQARVCGCQIMSPKDFHERICTPHKGQALNSKFEPPMSDDELAEWKRLFGIDD